VANRTQHLAILQQGVEAWNEWRSHNRHERPDFSKANLDFSRASLSGANFSGANLRKAKLRWRNLRNADLEGADLTNANLRCADLNMAGLSGADLSWANLSGANLSEVDLTSARLIKTDLSGTNLRGAFLFHADLSGANLREADFTGATLALTDLRWVNFEQTIGLQYCDHCGPSFIDLDTLLTSRNLPRSFLRGCGIPEKVIEYLPSLRDDAIQFYSCFISYSSKDQAFADRLHADLQNKGVRCWFARHDLPIGAKTWDAIDDAIRLRDKLLVILSKASIASDWVEDEVSKAYAEERGRGKTVLFPIRIDNTVMTTPEPWARKLRDQRNIGDFRRWKEPAEYQQSLERLLRDLKASDHCR
jgi:uncharacterized protein YjbI with pentapeptide repeats